MTASLRPCPLCHLINTQPLLVFDDAHSGVGRTEVVGCSECGLSYTRPVPSSEKTSELYSQTYYGEVGGGFLIVDKLQSLLKRSMFWQRRFAFLDRPAGCILDLGCGTGEFLLSLKRDGWKTVGVEPSLEAWNAAKSNGLDVRCGSLRDARFPSAYFDVVCLWHVLEHLEQPTVELEEIRRILKPDGLLIIEVPNCASLTFRALGKAWYHIDVPRHLQHFTPATLHKMLAGHGFEQLRRQDFHHWDFIFVLYSILNYLGLHDRLHITSFARGFSQAATLSKMLYMAVCAACSAFCLVYSILAVILTSNSESITLTYSKVC